MYLNWNHFINIQMKRVIVSPATDYIFLIIFCSEKRNSILICDKRICYYNLWCLKTYMHWAYSIVHVLFLWAVFIIWRTWLCQNKYLHAFILNKNVWLHKQTRAPYICLILKFLFDYSLPESQWISLLPVHCSAICRLRQIFQRYRESRLT